ncbi:HipA family kinase [Vibrio parahaemolyticus]|uniref:HipA family kinase n=1 Tax=Vibrio parahaemolyticus TaxID=670 RepID=UPI000BE28106|nr:HipA family kinase [Vibrio parahaemolyticus]ATI44563.1 hypothetical protein CO725_02605 [Vibrio parahaemolyticus]
MVELVTMLPGAQKVDDQNLNPTWKAHVITSEGTDRVAFVKLIEPRKIFVECFCALVGRNLGLPIPKPMVVNVLHDALPCSLPVGTTSLAFGSEDASHPSFRRTIQQNEPEAMKLIRAYSKILEVSIFDEWISNGDRNIGNILFDGKSIFNFIDHELALPQGTNKDTVASDNQLLRACFGILSEFEKHRASSKAKKNIKPELDAVDLKTALDNCLPSVYYSSIDATLIKDILQSRLLTVTNHVDLRIGLKQQGLAI